MTTATSKRKTANLPVASPITGRVRFQTESPFSLTPTTTRHSPAEITTALRGGRWPFRHGDELLFDDTGTEVGRFDWGVEAVLESHVDLGVPDQAGRTLVSENREDQRPQQKTCSPETASIVQLVHQVRTWVAEVANTRNSPVAEERRLIKRLGKFDSDYRRRTRLERAAMREAVEKECWAEFAKVAGRTEI